MLRQGETRYSRDQIWVVVTVSSLCTPPSHSRALSPPTAAAVDLILHTRCHQSPQIPGVRRAQLQLVGALLAAPPLQRRPNLLLRAQQAAPLRGRRKRGTDTSPAFVAKSYFGGVGRSEVRAQTCVYPFSFEQLDRERAASPRRVFNTAHLRGDARPTSLKGILRDPE